jgi:uncharacterized protein (DUF362 family)
MAKGVSVKFTSYSDTLPRLLNLLKFDVELQNHQKVVIKPFLRDSLSVYTNPSLVEQVLRYCLDHKLEATQIFIAEGSDGENTMELFEKVGYKKLAERYHVGLVDLNEAELENTLSTSFSKFESISYPKLLKEAFVISLAPLAVDLELGMIASLSNMIGAFSMKKYKGFFSKKKNKIRRWPLAYSVNDIVQCKMPDFAIVDASDKGHLFAGKPLDMDKQAARLLGKDTKAVAYLRLVEESMHKASAPVNPTDTLMTEVAGKIEKK